MLSAKVFFEQFKAKIYDPNGVDEDGIKFTDAFKMSGRYTKLFNKTIVPNILKANGLEISNEYYRVDVVTYLYGHYLLENKNGHKISV